MDALTEDLLIQTTTGKLQGVLEEDTIAFHKVPYAQPPVGPLRFRAPRPTTWTNIRHATKAGPGSYQPSSSNKEALQELVQQLGPRVRGEYPLPPGSAQSYDHPESSEDCLYLEIWLPKGNLKNLSTFVYYHGGANMISSGGMHLERPTKLCAQHSIIVVRPSYHLGALGWVHFGLISDEFPEAINLGVQDQIAALRWIHDNVRCFGGDPGRITVGGESCGATAVSHLLTYPPTQPIIRRAIMQSLSPYNNWCTQDKPEAATVAKMYMDLLEIDDPAELHTIHPLKLIAAHQVLVRLFPPDYAMAWRPLGAVVDGNFVPEHPSHYLSTKPYPRPDFELILGTAKDEWTLYRGQTETARRGTEVDAIAAISRVFGRGSKYVFERFQELYPGRSPGQLYCDIMGTVMFQFPTMAVARNMAEHGTPVYFFQFSYDSPGLDGTLRALHTGDMLFQWGNCSQGEINSWVAWRGLKPEDVEPTANVIGELYAKFIRYGNPGPRWTRFDGEENAVLWFGKEVETRQDIFTGKWEIFNDVGIYDVQGLGERLTRSQFDALSRVSIADVRPVS